MMATAPNPAVEAFLAQIGNALVIGQVSISRAGTHYELRHVADCHSSTEKLRRVQPDQLRGLAQFTSGGVFRPLKSAPDLQTGWRSTAGSAEELGLALNQLYPGALADWYAVQAPSPHVTHFREFASRQTGMYRVTTRLTDAQAARVARSCCHESLCLKRRLWTIGGLAPDRLDEKSLIPCLEPCAMLLELARKAMRMEQEEKLKIELSWGELAALRAALEAALAGPALDARPADFGSPGNPRCLRLILEKLAALPKPLRVDAEE
ncbi:MAG TPA: DR2241 family protein [Verrucomicrobiae bacterium]|nr:DR2241 family protein [Verrucomicrobiae bacterium]